MRRARSFSGTAARAPFGQSFQVPSHTAWYTSGVRGLKAWLWLSNTNKASAMTLTLKPSRTSWDLTSLNVLVTSRASCRGSGCNPDCHSYTQDPATTLHGHLERTWMRTKWGTA